MENIREISAPMSDDILTSLKAGDNLLITGTIYTGRDAAHKRLVDLINDGKLSLLILKVRLYILLVLLRPSRVKL